MESPIFFFKEFVTYLVKLSLVLLISLNYILYVPDA